MLKFACECRNTLSLLSLLSPPVLPILLVAMAQMGEERYTVDISSTLRASNPETIRMPKLYHRAELRVPGWPSEHKDFFVVDKVLPALAQEMYPNKSKNEISTVVARFRRMIGQWSGRVAAGALETVDVAGEKVDVIHYDDVITLFGRELNTDRVKRCRRFTRINKPICTCCVPISCTNRRLPKCTVD